MFDLIYIMNSDDDIKFYDPNRLGDILYIFHKNHKKYLNDELSKYDLNLVQVLCIFRINKEEGLSQKDLSDGFYLTKGAITKAITKLENNGIISREKSEVDKRQYALKLTEKGKKLVPILEDLNADWEFKMGFNELDSEFIETFKDLAFRAVILNNKK